MSSQRDAERWRVSTNVSTNVSRWHYDPDCAKITDAEPVPADEGSIQFHGLTPCAECADGPRPSDDQDWSDDKCPVCGDLVTNLGNHLRRDCDGGATDE
jgi:hypothetical protein